ncbi:zf-HC2 domain-containing protein [Isoptericola variabilis]|nr:zf-HC2 domain-containing protein [Isoptericola variabilis]
MREAAVAAGRQDGPGAPGTADPDVLRTALATLPHDDQQLLWDVHVHGRGVEAIAQERALHARAVQHRLRRAEERLATGFAAAHARSCAPGCLDTRSALQDYVRHRLATRRREALENHLFSCEDCMRAFIDIRQAAWALRDAAPALLAGVVGLAAAAPVVIGVGGAASSGVGAFAWLGSAGVGAGAAWEWLTRGFRQLGRSGTVGVASGAAVVAVAAVAVAVAGGGEPAPPGADEPAPPAAEAPAQAPAPAPAAPAPSTPEAPVPEPSDLPSDEPAAEPSRAPAPAPEPAPAREPATPSSDPAPEPTPDRTPGPAVVPPPAPEPAPSPTPSAAPGPTPTPTPSPDPTPETPAVAQVTLEVRGVGVFRVVARGDGAEITAVTGTARTLVTRGGDGTWYVRTLGIRDGSVVVDVTGPPGTQPSAALVSVLAPR